MPDNQMPYGDFGNLPQSQMPDPSMAFGNYSYAQNNQAIMNYGQTNSQATMQIVQNNFHEHMSNVLQGTMAAAMAVYNTGKSAHDKMREHIYGDQLLGNGVYAMERSAWRDVAFGSGLAGSDLGRALQIGGRRPEFMTGGEYAYQMNRSWSHRKGEWADSLMSGGLAAAGSTIGMAFGPPGIIAGAAFGYALDQTIGKIAQPYFEKRAAIREMSTFTEMADLNQGMGQRRMSADASADLAVRLREHDTSALKYIPFVGDAIAGRVGIQNKHTELFKKMAQQDLFRDLNPDDVDKITERIKKTGEVLDKFAGMMNTTRDTILQIKGKMNAMGMGDSQQNMMLGNLANFTAGTGLSVDTGMMLHGQFTSMGASSNYYRTGSEQMQGGFGLQGIASIRALQESGIISKSYDAATLGLQWYSNAANQSNTSWGRVAERGGGNVMQAKDYYETAGGGNAVLGMQIERLRMYGKAGNPLEGYRKSQDLIVQRLRASGKTDQQIHAFLLSRESSQEGAEQAEAVYTGMDLVGAQNAQLTAKNRMLEKIGVDLRGSSYTLGATFSTLAGANLTGLATAGDTGLAAQKGTARDLFEQMKLGTEITKESSKDLYYGYKKAIGYDKDLLHEYYVKASDGIATAEDRDKLKYWMKQKGYANDDSQADLIINQAQRKFDKDEKRYEQGFKRMDGSLVDFISSYKNIKKEGFTTEQSADYQRLFSGMNSRYKTNDEKLKAIEDVRVKLSGAKDDKERMAILQASGFVINDKTATGRMEGETTYRYDANFNKSYQAFMEFYKGSRNIDEKSLDAIGGNYETLIKSKEGKEVLGGISKDEYLKRFQTVGGELYNILKGGDVQDKKGLAQRLALITGQSMEVGTKMADFLASSGTEVRKTFLTNLQNQNWGALNDAAKNVAAGGTMTNDPQIKAIEKFTEVLEKLNTALTKK